MFKWIAKRALPIIAANIDLDIDTVVKSDGKYLRIRVEAFGFKLVDELVKASSEKPVENPIDVFKTGRALDFPDHLKRKFEQPLQ